MKIFTGRSPVLFALLMVPFLLAGGTNVWGQAAEGGVEKLPSYFEEQVIDDSEENHWYKLLIGEEWLGWYRARNRTYEIFEEGQIDPDYVEEYYWKGEISLPIVRRNFEDQVRKEVKKSGDQLTEERLRSVVEKKMQNMMQRVGGGMQSSSVSSVIYRDRDGSFREAKYVRSRGEGEETRVYLKQPGGARDRIQIMIPNERTFTRGVDPELEIMNYPLAARTIAEQFLSGKEDPNPEESLEFLMLAGNQTRPVVPATASVMEKEPEPIEIKDQKVKTWKVNVVIKRRGGERTMIWNVDRKGTIRKIRIQTGSGEKNEEGPELKFLWATREEARAGAEFVFSRGGRRNPFDPMWVVGSDMTKRNPECKEFQQEQMLEELRSTVNEAKKIQGMEDGTEKINRQIKITEQFSEQKGLIKKCGTYQARENIEALSKRMHEFVEFEPLLEKLGKEQVRSAKRAFRNQQYDQIEEYQSTLDELMGVLPEGIEASVTKQLKKKREVLSELVERGDIRQKFLKNAPVIRGSIRATKPRKKEVTFGMGWGGAEWDVPFSLTVPERTGAVVIQTQSEGGRVDEAREVGETFEVSELGEVTLMAVHPEKVVFGYKGESIEMTLKSEE